MIEKSDIAVVIQGPIYSTGRTMKDLKHNLFDATNNVSQLSQRIEKWGAKQIVVTWKIENVENLKLGKSAHVVQTSMPSKSLWFRIRNNYSQNNKYRQFFSVQKGVEYSVGLGVKLVLKIRTDQNLDIENLLDYVHLQGQKDLSGKIYMPLLNLDKPNMFYDFYYFSDTKTMMTFNKQMVDSKEICSNVHYDAFYRWGYLQKKRSILFNSLKVYPSDRKFTKKQLDVILHSWKDSFEICPLRIWRSIEWRGEAFDDSSIKEDFIFSDQMLKEEYLSAISSRATVKQSADFLCLLTILLNSRAEDSLRKLFRIFKSLQRRVMRVLNPEKASGKKK